MIKWQPIWFSWYLFVDFVQYIKIYKIKMMLSLRVPWQSRWTNHKWCRSPKSHGRKSQKLWLIVLLSCNRPYPEKSLIDISLTLRLSKLNSQGRKGKRKHIWINKIPLYQSAEFSKKIEITIYLELTSQQSWN